MVLITRVIRDDFAIFFGHKVKNGPFRPKMEPWRGHSEMDRNGQILFKNDSFFEIGVFSFKIFYFSFDGSLFVETEQNQSEFNRTRARPSRQPHTPVLHCWTHTVFKPYNPDYFLMIYGIDWNFVLILEIILRRKWREGWCMLIIT